MRAKMTLGGETFILPLEVADQILELAFSHGEAYEDKWNPGKDGGKAYYTKHIYEIDPNAFTGRIETISEAQYQMYKLMGKPQ